MPPKKKKSPPLTPSLVVGPLSQIPKEAGTRVKISLKPAKKASYTAYQNIEVTLGEDTYEYSEAWSLGGKKTVYDTFMVPKERRNETYKSVAYMWIESGGVDRSYKAGKLFKDPWGTAKGRKQRRDPPEDTRVVERVTTLKWNCAGKLQTPVEKRKDETFVG